MTAREAEERIGQIFRQTASSKKGNRNAYLLVHSDVLGIHKKYSYDQTSSGRSTDRNFLTTGLTKTFTAVLTSMLVEENEYYFTDAAANFLPDEVAERMHKKNSADNSKRILIRQLLNHTSGMADYLSEKPKRGRSILEKVFEDPDYFWTPQEILDWSKRYLKPHFKPGHGFYYSDTGYLCLGLMLENITGLPFHQMLHERIFEPLGMEQTYLNYYSEPIKKSRFKISPFFLGDIDVSTYKSMSVHWAGGGIISSTEDLLKFMQALKNGRLVGKSTLNTMTNDTGKYSRGMHHGYGLFNIRFREMFPLMARDLNVWGNFGNSGSFMFYNPLLETYFIGTFNRSNFESKVVRTLIKFMNTIKKVRLMEKVLV